MDCRLPTSNLDVPRSGGIQVSFPKGQKEIEDLETKECGQLVGQNKLWLGWRVIESNYWLLRIYFIPSKNYKQLYLFEYASCCLQTNLSTV